ncbi:hypothetical protein D0T53_03330 [Dysgonomonas sp. 216]|uniref:hypothetical protein n=1 Tax=Dysgonomonas sp. 216 TaxID=2302934 RepID=UPI0013D0E2F7|nr:hypothetical protein [Dysgonomonas sp. 216]NDW17949.1 hypothetical protein [Dysgonomonas sp. 216]
MKDEDSKISFKLIWGILMVIAYLGIAYLVVFTPMLIRYNARDNQPTNDENFVLRIVLGIILLAYGLFRGYRIWKTRDLN